MNNYLMEINYNVAIGNLTLAHSHRFRVKMDNTNPNPSIGTSADNIQVVTNGTGGTEGSTSLSAGLANYLGFYCGMFGSEMSITSAILIYYQFGLSGQGINLSSIDLSDPAFTGVLAGTNANTCKEAQQLTATFYDGRGKVSRLTYLEVSQDGNVQYGAGNLPTAPDALNNFITGSNGIVRGVDDSKLFSPKLYSYGENEAIWRKRYRS